MDLFDVRVASHSQWPDAVVGLVAGVVATAAFKSSLGSIASWLAIVSVAFVAFLLAYWVRRQLLLPTASIEPAPQQASALSKSIQASEHASYAVSSDWIDLWRSDAFTYYLSLDQACSLAIYTRSRHSPLAGLTDSNVERDRFLESCRDLMTKVGEGHPPVGEHRMRILIYPRKVYSTYKDRFIWLLRLHSAGRIPCIPVVSEALEDALSHAEREQIQQFTHTQLSQSLEHKIPPQPTHRWRAVKRITKESHTVVFPDLLLIDPQSLANGKLWWYSKRSVYCVEGADKRTTVDAANAIFRILCNKGRSAIWSEFTSDNIGNVPIATNRASTTAELFFALEYYRDWLSWIEKQAGKDPDASTLSTWLTDEKCALDQFVSSAQNGDGETHILDVGCGFGRHLLDIAARFPTMTGVGIDVIPNMVAEAAREARMDQLDKRLYFCKDDATVLETCHDSEFDLAICMTNTLGNLLADQATMALRQIHRCLKVGGRVLVSVYSSQSVSPRLHSYEKVKLHVEQRPGNVIEAAEGLISAHFDERALRQLFSDNGFAVSGVEPVGSIGLALQATKTSG